MTALTGSTTRRVMTALTLRVTLSRVMMSCERDFHGFLAEGDADDLVDGAEDEDDAGAGGVVADAAEAEDDGALVLLEDLDGVEEVEEDDGEDEEQRNGHFVLETSGRRESGGQSDCKALARGTYVCCLVALVTSGPPFRCFLGGTPPGGWWLEVQWLQ